MEVLSNVDSWENELSVAHIELVARKRLGLQNGKIPILKEIFLNSNKYF